jgi:glycosyltransferase involved in cell wall biosynthesis
MASDPLVSLVMPVWRPNRLWLRAAVAAALAEDGCDLELVIVDDGNDRPVSELLADVDDARIRHVRVDHGGVSLARNAGQAAAGGAFLRYVDADDVVAPGSTAHLLSLLDGRADHVAYGATLQCDERLRPRWRMTCRLQGQLAEATLLGRVAIRPHAMLFPRSVVERTGEWDAAFVVSGDWDFVLRAFEHATVVGDQRVASLYRRHGGSLTARIEEGMTSARRIVDRYFERHPDRRGTGLERRARAMLDAKAARVYASRGRWADAVAPAARAASTDPRALGVEVTLAMPALRAAARRHVRRVSTPRPGTPQRGPSLRG